MMTPLNFFVPISYNNPKLLDTVKQVTLLIAKTGLENLEYRSYPILDEDPAYVGCHR